MSFFQPAWQPPPSHSLVVPVLLLESDSGSEDGHRYRRWGAVGAALP